MSYFLLLLIPTVILLIAWNIKVDFYSKRMHAQKLEATVARFVKQTSPEPNDFILVSYAYVQIKNYNEKLVRLRYSYSGSVPYQVGDTVNVFWYAGVLYYWDTYDTGISKYLPFKWDFWNK